jgi:hypothetical protein
VFRSHNIFYGSGSSDPYSGFTDPDADPTHLLALSIRTIFKAPHY